MANKITLKKNSTSGVVPSKAVLERGELAINVQDGIVFFLTGTSGSEVVTSIGHGALRNIGVFSDTTTPVTADQTNKGFYYEASTNGTHATYGDFYIGDWLISTGAAWVANKSSARHLSGVEGGYAPLDASGKLPVSAIPDGIAGGMIYKGSWDAANNTPDLTDAANQGNGWYYIVSVDGTTDLDGNAEWKVGDWAVYHDVSGGTAAGWDKIDNTQESVTATQVSFDDSTSGTGSTNVQGAIDAISTRAHTYVGTIAPNDADGNDGDLYAYSDNADVANSVIYQKVNGTWVTLTSGSGGVTSFKELTDTPDDYAGSAGFITIVNASENGLVYTDTIDGGTY